MKGFLFILSELFIILICFYKIIGFMDFNLGIIIFCNMLL